MIAGCAQSPSGVSPSGRAPSQAAQPHKEARFWVDYGDDPMLVTVRYVSMMGQSAIAVRQAKPNTELGARRRIVAQPSIDIGEAENFADGVYEDAVIEIAETIRKFDGVCAADDALTIAKSLDGSPRTTYRRDRQVWVVFARCAPSKG